MSASKSRGRRDTVDFRSSLVLWHRAFDISRKLDATSAADVRRQRADNLRGTGLDEALRCATNEALRTLPEDEIFWSALAKAEGAGLVGSQVCARAFLLAECFSRRGGDVPEQWLSAADLVMSVRDMIRANGHALRAEWSRDLRHAWETDQDVEALASIVSVAGVNDPWIVETIGTLRERLVRGTRDQQREARSALARVGKALSRVGSRAPQRTDAERLRRKRDQIRIAKGVARLMKRYGKNLKCFPQPADAEKETLSKPSRQDPTIRRRIVSAFKVRVTQRGKGTQTPKQ